MASAWARILGEEYRGRMMEFWLVPEDQKNQEEGKEESSNLQKNRR